MKGQINILVTGVTGFVGQALLSQLLGREQFNILAALRSNSGFDICPVHVVGDFTESTDWSSVLTDQKVIIHTAARAHIMKDELADPLEEYRRVNVDGTLNLARQASAAGVKRFIFISSIKVNGEETSLGKPFTAEDAPAPKDAYGISKWEAEQGLMKIAAETGMEVVIIRPPLVYGPGVKGNFASMINLMKKGLPLPLGVIHNQRSLAALDNLVDLVITCAEHPAAANQVFLISDGEDVSTSDLLRKMASAYGFKSTLLPVPVGLMKFAAKILGKGAVADRLFGNLQVDSSKALELLGWKPVVTMDEELAKMAGKHVEP